MMFNTRVFNNKKTAQLCIDFNNPIDNIFIIGKPITKNTLSKSQKSVSFFIIVIIIFINTI